MALTWLKGSLKLIKLGSWFVSTEFCDHGSHNGLKWPLKDEIGIDEMTKMWAIKQSCRSTAASLAEYREHWIANGLEFRAWASEGSNRVWTLIGTDSTVCDLIVTLSLRVMGSSILVAEDYANDDQIVQKVSHVMGAVCQWKEWTDSLWVTIGDTSISMSEEDGTADISHMILAPVGLQSFLLLHRRTRGSRARATPASDTIRCQRRHSPTHPNLATFRQPPQHCAGTTLAMDTCRGQR